MQPYRYICGKNYDHLALHKMTRGFRHSNDIYTEAKKSHDRGRVNSIISVLIVLDTTKIFRVLLATKSNYSWKECSKLNIGELWATWRAL